MYLKKLTKTVLKVVVRNVFRVYKLLRVFLYLNFSNEMLTRSRLGESDTELIVSLTTYGQRINNVALAIASIGLQTHKADRIILWLDELEFKSSSLPKSVLRLMERGLEVRFCPNYRSYKKYMPTRQLHPDDIIVTIDDDFLYPKWLLGRLVIENKLYPSAIIGLRAHAITRDSTGAIRKYRNWDFEITYACSPGSTFLTTGGGVLFPPKCFQSEVALDANKFMKYCPTGDDIWFKCMSIYEKIEYRNIPDVVFWRHFYPIDTKGEASLKDFNLCGANDDQINSMAENLGISLAVVDD